MIKQKYMLYEKQADIVKAIAHPIRIGILDLLSDGEKCVCDIAAYLGSERSNVSRHLAVMSSAGILEQRKEGLNVFYRLRTPCILKFLSCVSGVLKENLKDNGKLLAALS